MKIHPLSISLVLAVFASGCSRRETLLYEGRLEPTRFRYAVYSTGSGSMMPGGGDGGPGRVKVFDTEGRLILDRKMKSTQSDIMATEGQLIIAGQEAIDLPTIKK